MRVEEWPDGIAVQGGAREAAKYIRDHHPGWVEYYASLVTSPPYYGQGRNKDAIMVIGGDPECDHDWVELELPKTNMARKGSGETKKWSKLAEQEPPPPCRKCAKCYRFEGCLGSEPDPGMYAGHLSIILDIVRARLGLSALWVNLWDSRDSIGSNKGGFTGSLEWFKLKMMELGYVRRSNVIWDKPNAMPDPQDIRPYDRHEDVYLFTMGDYFYEPACERTVDRTGWKVIGDVWSIELVQGPGSGHFSVMSLPLAERLVQISVPKGGTVVDPFAGFGTTAVAARRMARQFIVFELFESNFDEMCKRIDGQTRGSGLG